MAGRAASGVTYSQREDSETDFLLLRLRRIPYVVLPSTYKAYALNQHPSTESAIVCLFVCLFVPLRPNQKHHNKQLLVELFSTSQNALSRVQPSVSASSTREARFPSSAMTWTFVAYSPP